MSPYSASTRLVTSPRFSRRLIERMEEADIGTLELAEAAEINKETISLWRGGKQGSYTYEKVARVAAALGTSAEDLLDLPALEPASHEVQTPTETQASRPQEELVRRIAKLAPLIESLSQLEEVITEARKLAGD